ncbi:hypothetical protein ANCDUO_19692 [Ancylostoma duodenale]|uniref:Uncharacterized protein n=1 Tax=Ancylostoma duodenale TaxID=51022 RepID=A0A0C2FNQ4_9BILA|nr:hypothetical protein ANCDUO_19692 [Ancylostoma duodenale]
MLFVSIKRTESIGRVWRVRGTNGRIAGARSVHPKINGGQVVRGLAEVDVLNSGLYEIQIL